VSIFIIELEAVFFKLNLYLGFANA
jgi:hypothetical protein